MKSTKLARYTSGGFSLLEVVLAIAVFAFGMLALVELQTGLARSGSDANTRTVAANIAEELVETARGFTQIQADAGNGRLDYNEIVSYGAVDTVNRAGYDYSVNVQVQEHYWDADAGDFTTTQPTGIVNSDFKTMDIVVMWRPLEAGESLDDYDTIDFNAGGALRIVEAIPSTPGLLGAMVASDKEATGTPPVDYNPGENPDIVALTLDADGGKFKEATSATPDVIRDDAVETWFDVVTYSQTSPLAQASFLRREEFVAVTCECELETSPAEADYGLLPTLWNGVTYTEGEQVQKPIGTAPNGVQQSPYCSVCCRDHHDGGGSGIEQVYNRANVGNNSDHPHYARNNRGEIIDTPVGDGDRYVEACRLVRKDGFMRVTQDASQAVLVGFPGAYLEFADGAGAYSEYVVDSISDYYGVNGQSDFQQLNPPDNSSPYDEFPARTEDTATLLPSVVFPVSQQLRARAVYTDYLTSAAQAVIDECFPIADRTDDCPAPYASTPLEIYPFFDLQMTWLARWTDDSMSAISPVRVSNEALETGNTHSRGVAEIANDNAYIVPIGIRSHAGNLGLTATGPIDLDYDDQVALDTLYISANSGETPVPAIGNLVSGSLSSSLRRVPAADLSLTSETAICGQTDTEWSCIVPDGGALLTVGNYYLNNPTVNVCSDLTLYGSTTGTSAETVTTTFVLPGATGEFDIWITDQPCEGT